MPLFIKYSFTLFYILAEAKYRYNTKTLSYERHIPTFRERILKVSGFIVFGLVFAVGFLILFFNFFASPNEKQLKRENEQLLLQYELLNKRLDQIETVLADVQNRDDNIYRVIFEAEPIPSNIRKAGFGGVNRYKELEKYSNADLLINTTKRLDVMAKELYIQSKSLDEIFDLAKKKEKMLASIPAIQPVSNKDLNRMASGYGMRIHPVYKTLRMHTGMDFSAPTGTEVYATGSGTVVAVDRDYKGYGNHIIIDHGYGYKTLYGHLSSFKVKVGQKINRGELIGLVGSTGTSTAPHVHYEVIKNGNPINPINFYFNDLTAEEFDKMLQMSSSTNQAFD